MSTWAHTAYIYPVCRPYMHIYSCIIHIYVYICNEVRSCACWNEDPSMMPMSVVLVLAGQILEMSWQYMCKSRLD